MPHRPSKAAPLRTMMIGSVRLYDTGIGIDVRCADCGRRFPEVGLGGLVPKCSCWTREDSDANPKP